MNRNGWVALLGLFPICLAVWAQAPYVPKEIQDALKALKDPDAKVRAKAAWVLADQGKNAVPVLDELIAAFADPKLGIRASLADAFGQMGPRAKKAVPAMLSALKDEDPRVRRRVVNALGLIISEAKTVVPALVEAFKDPDQGKDGEVISVPEMAVLALGNFGPDAKPAVPALLQMLKDPKTPWRFSVVSSLSRIQDPAAVPHLVKLMDQQKDIFMRGQFAGALGRFGPNAKQAIPQMIAILKTQGSDENTLSAKQNAAGALGKMGAEATPETVKVLIEVMKDQKLDSTVRRFAARSLVELGPKVAKDAIPAMIEVLHQRKPAHGAAVESLIAMGKAVVPHLIPLAARFNGGKENDNRVREDVLFIFLRLGPEAKDAIGVITGVVAENNEPISQLAQMALDSVSGTRNPEKK